MAEWREAPEVKEIADALIPEHHQRIELYMDDIRYIFRDKAAKSNGHTVFGKAHKVGGMACYLMHSVTGDVNKYGDQPPSCFVIEIAEPVWENMTQRQRVALVDHELEHLDAVMNERTGEMSLVLKPHDVEEFRSIVARHGAWHPPLTEFAEALQLSLLDPEVRRSRPLRPIKGDE